VHGIENVTKFPLNPPSGMKKAPDLVILGGGAWDKLWAFTTDAEKNALKKSYDELAEKMQELRKRGVPVVWMTPTTINNDALPSEEKRARITEEEIEFVRELQVSQGVLTSASFVVDGPSFTASRVSESFDGVHYPHQVYSAGAQVLANAVDWLLPIPIKGDPKPPNQPGAMAHMTLGLMILVVAAFGIIGFDGFMGFSYLAAIFVPSVAPARLYYEAFSDLHRRKKLPSLERLERVEMTPQMLSQSFDEEEVVGLVDNKTS
jgi:hypothetical protein